MPRYRSSNGKFISNRAGRRQLWRRLATGKVALRNRATRAVLAKRGAVGASRIAARALGTGALRTASRFVPYVGAALTAADIGYSAYKYFKGSSTPKRGRRYNPGSFGGYMTQSRISNAEKRVTRRKLNTAYQLSVEKSGTQTPTIAGILGHSTISRTYAVRALFGALLRMVMYRNGMKANSPSQTVVPMVTGTVIGIEFQYAAASNDGFSITITAPITFTQILDAFISAWNTKYDSISATLIPNDIRFRNIYIRSPATANSANTCEIDLINAKVQVYCSSSLKIQNRSVNTADDDDADDVDQVPLNMTSYSGWGTGLDSRYDYLGLGFCANQDCIIATSDPALAGDAPLPALLQGVKRSGFGRLSPGQIKTDVVKHSIYVSLDTYTRLMLGPRGNANLRLSLGKFSFLHYEKTIEANNASPVAMSIAYENQLYVSAKIIVKSGDLPIPEFFRS